jgi:cysteine synthase
VVASSLLDLIGNTPLVELQRLSPPGRTIYAKLEGQNPTGSVKDRVALAMVDAANLEPGARLLEPTSGNTGISLALVAKLRGHSLKCVMPANATPERRALLELYGAEIVESPGELGSNGAVRMAQEIAASDPGYTMLFQYENDANPRAHYEGTGLEIARELMSRRLDGGDTGAQVPASPAPERESRLDAFVAGLGTGGTLMGAGRRLREAFPGVQVVAAEPLPGDPVMGLRSLDDGYVPPVLDVSQLDRKLLVSNEEAAAAARALLEQEGIFAGVSAGAAVHVARRVAEELPEGSVVACVLADGGWKYLSAPFWQGEEIDESRLWW